MLCCTLKTRTHYLFNLEIVNLAGPYVIIIAKYELLPNFRCIMSVLTTSDVHIRATILYVAKEQKCVNIFH